MDWQKEKNILQRLPYHLPYFLYSGLGRSLGLLAFVLLPLIRNISCFGGRYRYRLAERFGAYSGQKEGKQYLPCVWIHAASVGEVQAALQLIGALEGQARVVLSTNTEQGHRLASSRLDGRALCLMAPLDLPQAVNRALACIQPDVYVGLETELWPVLLTKLKQVGIPLFLLNGRLSERSFGRYWHIRFFMQPLLCYFHTVAAISNKDGARFLALGLPAERLRTCGNMKYDMEVPDKAAMQQQRDSLRQQLELTDKMVFVCGSTHSNEEQQLLSAYAKLKLTLPLVWIVAPRHLERLPEVESLLQTAGLNYDRYSLLKKGEKKRCQSVILLDTMGDLADLYACGDYLFCGGSLVAKGGHNLMEAARWARPVYFGPYMKSCSDAAAALQELGGGFQVRDTEALAELILHHHHHPELYSQACAAAVNLARQQQGSVRRQAELLRPVLTTSK